jgi:radical SAM superfamily enzyme YgiQ (UPF0313 family)
MRIALLRAKDLEDAREANVSGVYPPLGLAYLAAYLRERGHEVTLHDGEAPARSISTLLREIHRDTSLIGVSSTTLGWPTARKTARLLRRRFGEIPLVIGGPHVTAFPDKTLEHSDYDLGVMGDGEWALAEIVARLARNEALSGIPGTVFRGEQGPEANHDVRWIRDLDSLPMPALDLLPMSLYSSVVVRQPFVAMLASRGCPYRCSFCSQIYTGETFRTHSAERILAEMERAERQLGAREIILFDETFGAKRGIAMEVCREIPRRGLSFRWNARTRIDLLDDELLSAMRAGGCYLLHLGIESGTQRILDRMRKGITIERIESTVRRAKRLGFQVHGYFMLGYPGETRGEVEETLAFSRRLPLDWASYTVTVPSPRTPLQQEAEDAGLLDADFWDRYMAGETARTLPTLGSPECDTAYLLKAKQHAYLRFYLRPGTLLGRSAFVLQTGGIHRLTTAGLLWMKELAR